MRLKAALLAVGGLATMLVASSARAATDWTTYSFDNQRTGRNPAETRIGVGNVGSLKLSWSINAGGAVQGEPLVATGVATVKGSKDLVYVGTLLGKLLALDRTTGKTVWQHSLPTVRSPCGDDFGVTGTPVLDRARHAVYLADADGKMHALNEATGAELPGWPVTLLTTTTVDYFYDGVTLVGGSLYVGSASDCFDAGPFRGRVFQVDIASHSLTHTWYVNGPKGPFGGGVWGPAGLSAEPDGSSLYAATGNATGKNVKESAGLSEHVVHLSPSLVPLASDYPGLTGRDTDFGATPMLYQANGCPPQLAVMNKTGAFLVYDRARIGDGNRQRLQIGNLRLADHGNFVGNPAYEPTLGLIYVNNPTNSSAGTFKRGLVALKIQPSCSLALAWQAPLPRASTPGDYPSIPPTVANGVVYAIRSNDSVVYAFNAATGKPLWNSGTQVKGGIYAPATVANGQVLVASFGGTVAAFAP